MLTKGLLTEKETAEYRESGHARFSRLTFPFKCSEGLNYRERKLL